MIVMLRLNGVLRYGSKLWTLVSSAIVTAVDSGRIAKSEALKSGMTCVSKCLHVMDNIYLRCRFCLLESKPKTLLVTVVDSSLSTEVFFLVGCFTCAPDNFELVY